MAPTLEELFSDDRLPSSSRTQFLTTLLKSSKKAVTDRICRLVNSFSADFVYGVSGELTSKHYLLAHGLHCITGNKETVQITNRLGHCVSYDTVLDIETAQAQKAVTLRNNADTSVLPLQPKSDEETVLTVFWAENFDRNVDKETGGGTINMTTTMAFQESSIGAARTECKFSVPKTKSQTVTLNFDEHNIVFYDKQELNILRDFSFKFFTWLYLRYCNRFEQIYLNLSGMLLRLRQKQFNMQSITVSKTVETYHNKSRSILQQKSPILRQYIHTSSISKCFQRKWTCHTSMLLWMLGPPLMLTSCYGNTPNSFPMLFSMLGIFI